MLVPYDIKCLVPSDAVHPGSGVFRHTVDLPGLQGLHERSLHNVLNKFEVVQAKNASQYRCEFAGLMPEKMIHEVMDARRVAHRNLWIDDLNRTHFHAAAALEDRTVPCHVGRFVDRFSTDEKVSPDKFFTFGKRSTRDDLIRRAQDFAGSL